MKNKTFKKGSLPYGLVGMGGFLLTMLGLIIMGVEVSKLMLELLLSAWLLGEMLIEGAVRLICRIRRKEKDLRFTNKKECKPEEMDIQSFQQDYQRYSA